MNGVPIRFGCRYFPPCLFLLLCFAANASNAFAQVTANFVGVGADVVSPISLSPDGQPDFQINVSGLRSMPARIRIVSDAGGVWVSPYNGFNWIVQIANFNAGTASLFFSESAGRDFTLQFDYSDGSTDQVAVSTSLPPSTLTAIFMLDGADVVGKSSLPPDGWPDFNVRIAGLRSQPLGIQVISDGGGVWDYPYNGSNWVVALDNFTGNAANIHFAQSFGGNYLIRVTYADGTTDAISGVQPPTLPSTLTAVFTGLDSDVVGMTSGTPDGFPDFNVRVSGLRSLPVGLRVISDTGGLWEFPYNGFNWIVVLDNYFSGAGIIHFAQSPSNNFTVQVAYSDGTVDQAGVVQAPPPTSTLTATFSGLGADVVSEIAFSPDGRPDFNINVGGLRSQPVGLRVLADTGGDWEFPFNGNNWVAKLDGYNAGAGNVHFSVSAGNRFTLQVAYSDGTTDQTGVVVMSPPPSTLRSTSFSLGPDVIGTTSLSPDGRPDFIAKVTGLRSVPIQIQIRSESGGLWKTPFNGVNWIVGLANYNAGYADLYFSQSAGNAFEIQVIYADGTWDQTNVLGQSPAFVADIQRLLEQATFGPTATLKSSLQANGIEAFLRSQLYAPMQDYPDLAFWPQTRPATCIDDCQRDNYSYYQVQRHFFANALGGQDQLRQRVAFGLSQTLVTSQTDVPMPAWMRSYQQLLYRSAFGNFRQLLYDVTLHPTMGRFLDMVNNRCQRGTPLNVNICRNGLTSEPNENYAREVLQLFSIGTVLLNPDGTRKLDGSNNPIPSYDQKTIEEFARVFTGWVLSPSLVAPAESGATTAPNYRDPMVQHLDSQSREDYHDHGDKILLNGAHLAAGRTASQDLNDAIDNIAYHPNVAPYMSKQLIVQLVTSNPSPAYVARIAAVWTASRFSQTQLFDVVKAILLDPEARGDNRDPIAQPNYGKLREPVLFMTNILRSLNGVSDGILNSPGGGIGTLDMSEDLFNAPSVFNYFPPSARVPLENAVGPEFALFSSLTALRRDNFVNQVIFSTIAPSPPNRPLGTSINLTSFSPLAGNPDQLIEALNSLMLHGSMSADMRLIIKTAVSAVPAASALTRVRTAVYLIATSSQYQVQR